MMKTALCTWLMPLLLLLPVTEADLSSSEELVYPISPVPGMRQEFKATVYWTSSMVTRECWARRLDWPGPYTRFMFGETKTIINLGNKCLQFTCGFSSKSPLLDLNEPWSACAHRHGCFRIPLLEKIWYLLDYTCNCFVTSHQYIHYVVKDKGLIHGHLSVVSRFVCQKTDRRSTRALSSDGYGMLARGPPRGTKDLGYEVVPSTRNGCIKDDVYYPLRSIVVHDPCYQSICLMGDARPQWKMRALGCQGLKGCMQFGEQYVDPVTKNIHRCEYQLAGLSFKNATFYRACVENGTILAVGESFFKNDAWYSCRRHRRGFIKTPKYRTGQRENGTRFCGDNNITAQSMYSGQVYFMKVGTCFFTSSCKKTCNYFDNPCQTREMSPYETQSIGDKIYQNDSECVCTQSQSVSNIPLKKDSSDFTNLYLCGEKGVRGAACKDPEKPGIFRKWGELWSDRQSRLCGCHPLQRKAFCSHNVDEVISPKTNYAK